MKKGLFPLPHTVSDCAKALALSVATIITAIFASWVPSFSSVAIIGGSDGPTVIYLAAKEPPCLINSGSTKEKRAQALLKTFCDTVTLENNTLSFQIPQDPLPTGLQWSIHIAGRTKSGMSMHWLEEEETSGQWVTGQTYTAAPVNPEELDSCDLVVSILAEDPENPVAASTLALVVPPAKYEKMEPIPAETKIGYTPQYFFKS